MRVILAQLTKFPEAGRVDICEYAKALAKLGHDTHVIVCENMTEGVTPGLTVHDLGISTNAGPSNSLRFSSLALAVIKRLHGDQKIDVIHLFNPAPATYTLGLRLKALKNRPKIIYDIRTGGIGNGFDSHLINGMAKTSPFFADGVITLSTSLFTRLFGSRNVIHAVVPLGVATDRYGAKTKNPDGTFSFAYIGSLSANRRLATLVSAFAITFDNHAEARLAFIGNGDEREALINIVKNAGLDTVITFVKTVPFKEIPDCLAAADCGISYIPITPWFNPQPPLKTLEYLAAGLPVVATATDSHKELWKDLPHDLLRLDTTEDMAAGMEYAITHARELARIDFKKAALPFDWTTISEHQLVPFYQKVLER